jgi:predicted AAA+ superfamily ATPase
MVLNGVSPENILALSFFDDRLDLLRETGLGVVIEAYFLLYPMKKNVEKIYCFFDEIQVFTGWEKFVERLMRTEICEIYITGSSAKMLSTDIATEMRGRSLAWEMFPFSFSEYLDYKNIALEKNLTNKARLLIENAFDEYWQCGGFPETMGIEKTLRIKVHQEYLNTLIFKDIVQRYDVHHPKAVIDLAHQLLENIANMHSINSLAGYLKSLGHKLSKTLVSEYVKWFEDAYFIFGIGIFNASIAENKRNPQKYYCIDFALVSSTTSGILTNSGHLLENLVFITLRRLHQKIYYYRTKSGKEVDFIVQHQDKSKTLIQVSETLRNSSTRKRELIALQEAMLEQNVQYGLIVTLREEESVKNVIGEIQVVPLWRFLLDKY